MFVVFQGLGLFRLLIQRCEGNVRIGKLFDRGMVLPDECTRAPGEGYDRGGRGPNQVKGPDEKDRDEAGPTKS